MVPPCGSEGRAVKGGTVRFWPLSARKRRRAVQIAWLIILNLSGLSLLQRFPFHSTGAACEPFQRF